MSRPRSLKPRLCCHKATGRSFVIIAGRQYYCGKLGTQAAQDRYDQLIAAWIGAGRPASIDLTGTAAARPSLGDSAPTPVGRPPAAAPADDDDGISVEELIDGFWTFAQAYHRKADGTPSTELSVLVGPLRILRRLYGDTPAARFGPLALKACRAEMIRLDWSRRSINKQCSRIRSVFKWGVENEQVPPDVLAKLKAVAGLRIDRSDARERLPASSPSRRRKSRPPSRSCPGRRPRSSNCNC